MKRATTLIHWTSAVVRTVQNKIAELRQSRPRQFVNLRRLSARYVPGLDVLDDRITPSTIDFFAMPDRIPTNLSTFLIAGATSPGNKVAVGGVTIPQNEMDEYGAFDHTVTLAAGDNPLTVTITDADGQQVVAATKVAAFDPTFSTSNRKLLYLDAVSVDTVSPALDGTLVIDVAGNMDLGILPGRHIRGISPNGTEIYMDDRTVLGTSDHQILRTLPFTQSIPANGFLVSPTGNLVYSRNEVVDLSVTPNKLLAPLPVDITTGSTFGGALVPGGPAISLDGTTIYGGTPIVRVNTVTNSATPTGITTRSFVSDLAFSPDGTHLLVASYGGGVGAHGASYGEVDIYDTATEQLLGFVNLGDFTGQVGFFSNTIAVVGNAGNPASFSGSVNGGAVTIFDFTTMQTLQLTPGMLADNVTVSGAKDEVYATSGDRKGVDVFAVGADKRLTLRTTFVLGINGFVPASGHPKKDQLGRSFFKPSADQTPPTVTGVPNDGTAADIDFQNSMTALSANWASVFADDQSDVTGFEWEVGTTPAGSQVFNFTTAGIGGTNANATGLALTQNQIYYVTIRATNGAGLRSTATSDGVVVDTTPPSAGSVNDGSGADINFQASTTMIAANWAGFSDSGSGIASYQWAIGTSPGGTDVQAFTNIGSATNASTSGLSLSNGTTYYVSVNAIDRVGNVSSVASSNGVTVDSTSTTAITGTTPNTAIFDSQTATPFTNVVLIDGDGNETYSLTVTLSATVNGTLSNLAGGSYNAATGVYTSPAGLSLAQAQSALRGLVFTPKLGQVPFGQAVITNFNIRVNDAGVTPSDNSTNVRTSPVAGPDANWLTKVGTVTITGNGTHLVASAATPNVAVDTDLFAANVSVQANFTLAASGTNRAGLVARYTGDGDTNMYLAQLTGNSTNGAVAYISSNVGGAWTLLATVPGLSGTGTLRFDVLGNVLKLFLNGTLVASLADNAIQGPGNAGVRGNSATFDKFSAARLFSVLSFNDNFNPVGRPNFDVNFIKPVGGASVVSSKLAASSAPTNVAVYAGMFNADVSVQADVDLAASGTNRAGLVARYTGDGDTNMYLANLVGTSTSAVAYISRNVGGAWTLLATVPGLSGTGTLRFDVLGNTLKLFLNDTLVASVVDNAIQGPGLTGVRSSSAATFDNFFAARLLSPPFSDNFDRPNSSDLGVNFAKKIGDLSILGNKLATSAAVSAAVYTGMFATDVSVQAEVALAASGTNRAGLVARYSGDGDTNMYYANLVGNRTSAVAYISRNVGGTWTLLATVSGLPGTGTLRFDVVGDALKLFLNGNLVASVVDDAIQGPGLTGVRGNNSTFDNLTCTSLAA